MKQLGNNVVLSIARTSIMALGSAWLAMAPAAVWAADTVPPSTPGNFQAVVTSGESAVTLSWAPATDASGVKAYQLDRSLDQVTWETLAHTITGLSYRDTTTRFGLRYFYRVQAIDGAGNRSDWAVTDVSIDEVGTDSNRSSEAVYTSLDKLATAQLPAGAASNEISCTVNALDDVNGKKVGTPAQPLVLGPYELACRTTAGSVVTDFKKQVTWVLDVKDKLKGLHDPGVYAYDADGKGAWVKGAQFDSKSETLKVDLPPTSIVTVQASKPQGIPLNFIVIVLVVAGLVAGIIIFAINRKKKLDYDAHLRSKYYDL